MKRTNFNFIIFALVLFLICFLMNRSMQENSQLNFRCRDIVRTEPERACRNFQDKEETGWKEFYRKNYLKGNVEYPDNFNGTVIRNYLDNLNFYLQLI